MVAGVPRFSPYRISPISSSRISSRSDARRTTASAICFRTRRPTGPHGGSTMRRRKRSWGLPPNHRRHVVAGGTQDSNRRPCRTALPPVGRTGFTPSGAGRPAPPNSRRLELCQNLAGLRAPAHLFLGEDRLTVGDDLEDAPGGGNQTHRCHIVFLSFEDLFRHTDGMGEIPS